METLDKTDWDIVICGTGLPQSLLALALSRSGKRILHIDQNDYYGGDEAALSLSEAEDWAHDHEGSPDAAGRVVYTSASVVKTDLDATPTEIKLGSSRAYSVALAPQLVYARSDLLPALVSSRTHSQLEFQAVGSWFIVETTPSAGPRLIRVPNGREDIFQDTTFDLKAKRSLMKLLRYVNTFEEQDDWAAIRDTPFTAVLENKFGLPEESHQALLALSLIQELDAYISTETAVINIARHLRSIGIFGPGFSAVLPKWGGLAEISQVACRACAVGGGVYVLKKGLIDVVRVNDGDLVMTLSDGEILTSKWLVSGCLDLPSNGTSSIEATETPTTTLTRSISIVSSPLTSLFPRTSEGGVVPAGAVVRIMGEQTSAPVHILVHSSESGECPSSQCILYASVAATNRFKLLEQAVASFLESVDEQSTPIVLWRMQYVHKFSHQKLANSAATNVVTLGSVPASLALEDEVLEDVKKAWMQITGEEETAFMRFEAREGAQEED